MTNIIARMHRIALGEILAFSRCRKSRERPMLQANYVILRLVFHLITVVCFR